MSTYPYSLIIDINASGLRPATIKDIILARLDTHSVPRPLASKLEEEGDYKGLLT
jgi:adenylate/nucleoside-diphosphate kinase